MITKKGLAVWSVGAHARRNLLPAIALTRHWRFAGCTTRNREAGESAAAQFGGHFYETPEAMLADTSVEAVLLAGPNGVHFDQAKAALSAGKHTLVEKSMCPKHVQTLELAALAQAKHLVLAECFMYLHHPQFAALLARASDTERYGPVKSVTARFGFPHLPPDDIRYSKALAGGSLLDAGAYCISSLSQFASNTSVNWARTDHAPPFEVDIGGVATLDLDGVTGIADWGFGRSYQSEIEVWCAGAVLRARRVFAKPPELVTSIVVTDTMGEITEIPIRPANHFVTMFDAMGAAIADPAARVGFLQAAVRQSALLDAVRKHATL